MWRHIARHLVGRTAQQVKHWFLRTTHTDTKNSAVFNSDLTDMFALTVVPKNINPDMEITSKLQHEVRFLVMGT